ncbi:CIS tube protein [Vannielia litorea]|uniref:CIS tube protein n=1 Tax=Vannielia litorea TaxID=1217970 RepID=UPI001BCD3570|nr:hypothetical protein [Vannielia litorea]MBS8226345.1 hypothetical protein [Vannielia litorea]
MLSKLQIIAYKDDELRSKVGSYAVQLNPESYEHRHHAEFTTDRGIDAAGAISQFKSRAPEVLSFAAVIDATGVVPGVSSIDDELGKIRKVAYSFNGSIHSPNYLRVAWGKLTFDCQLVDLNVSYLLFSPQGLPLRARLIFTFRQHQTPADLARGAGKQSADLTHQRVVREEAGLSLMCYDVYGDPGLYPQVGRANDLNDVMHVPEGRALNFPPVRGQ